MTDTNCEQQQLQCRQLLQRVIYGQTITYMKDLHLSNGKPIRLKSFWYEAVKPPRYGCMFGNTDGSSLVGMDGEMNDNTVSLPGKNKYKSSGLWRYRCGGKKTLQPHTRTQRVLET